MNFSIPAKDIWSYINNESTIEVKQSPVDYGFTTTYVTQKDGKYYMFDACYSSDGGLQTEENVDFEEVEPRETVVTTWHKVKTNKILREEPPTPQKCVKAWPVFDTVDGEYPRD